MSTRPPNNSSSADSAQPGGDAAGPRLCTHCGLPVPRGLILPDSGEQFCCNGCRTVYGMIHGCGLDRFYQLREGDDFDRMPARTTDHRYAEFDDPAFAQRYYQEMDSEASSVVDLYLEGIHCMACVWLVEKLPRIVPGVVEARLDVRRSLIRVFWNDREVKLSRIARALDSLGYPPHPARDAKSREIRRREDQRFLIRLGVAGACAGNVMTLAFALYGGVFTGIETQYSQLFRWTSMLLGMVSLAWPGSLFLRGAWAALRSRTAHLDLPIALALLAGGVAGTINAIRGHGEIYFDSLTMLVFLLLLGRWIQRRQQRWSSDALELLFSLTPTSARRVEADGVHEVPIEAVSPHDLLEVRAGDSVPADGTILEGRSTVDQSLLTGESRPVSVAESDPLHAGAVNLTARLLLQVHAVGSQTRVGKLMQLVEECGRRQAPIVQFADRVAGWFVAVVLFLALLTFGIWLKLDAIHAVDHAVALLIVTCPCALGLATPLAMTVALGRGAERQILIKGGEVLELLAGRGLIVLDKTGTLTAGRNSLVAWFGDTSVQPAVAALERHSAHPIAQTLVAAFETQIDPHRWDSLNVVDCQQQPGAGLAGSVAGRRLVVGTKSYVSSQEVCVGDSLLEAERNAVRSGASPVFVGVDGQCVAVGWIDDPLREDAAESVERLQAIGWRVEILSGDHPAVVTRVGQRLGLLPDRVVGGASPEEKVAFIERAAVSERVVMVGDGVNDAAALSAASVGIAVHGGAEASLAAADVYLNRPGLSAIAELIGAARNTLRTIHRSLAISLVYNGVAASLAMVGLIGPLFAAVLMPISSFTVLALAYFSPTFGEAR